MWTGLLRHRDLLRLFSIAFLLMSVFVTLHNYVGYRLTSPPYALSQSAIGLVSLTYLLGMFGSSMAGLLIDHLGPRGSLGAGLAAMGLGVLTTLFLPVPVILAGIGIATGGFFVAHAVASGSVGRLSGPAKGQAASLYLLFYYAGSSLTGSGAGWFWEHGGWPTITALTGMLTLLGLGLTAGIRNERAFG